MMGYSSSCVEANGLLAELLLKLVRASSSLPSFSRERREGEIFSEIGTERGVLHPSISMPGRLLIRLSFETDSPQHTTATKHLRSRYLRYTTRSKNIPLPTLTTSRTVYKRCSTSTHLDQMTLAQLLLFAHVVVSIPDRCSPKFFTPMVLRPAVFEEWQSKGMLGRTSPEGRCIHSLSLNSMNFNADARPYVLATHGRDALVLVWVEGST